MNSFKKIALALVATMTLGALTTAPANASSGTTALKVGGSSLGAGVGLTSLNPASLPVPADNSVDSADALHIGITGLLNNTTVTASAVNGRIVTALATLAAPVTAGSGSASVSINTGTGTTADLYVFTTLATDGMVSVTIAGNTTTYYFKGNAGALNSIALNAPASAAAGTIEKVSVAGFDVFGNPKGGAVINLQVITTTSTTTALTTDSATTVTTVLGSKSADVLIPASGTVTLVATASVAAPVFGLASPVGLVIKTIAVRDLLAELNALRAELAAEKAGRAADKVTADKALTDAIAKAAADLAVVKAELATAKADAAAAKLDADNALLTATKAAEEAKIASDKAIADLKAQVNALNRAVASLKKRYNSMAKKFRFTPLP
jgi:hypothetical protein